MTINASGIPSVVAMSAANIAAKRDLRYLIKDRMPDLVSCLDALGDDPILCQTNADLTGKIQHVDLTQYYAYVGEAISLLTQAYDVLGQMHNEQTNHGTSVGIVMDAPNGGGGGR